MRTFLPHDSSVKGLKNWQSDGCDARTGYFRLSLNLVFKMVHDYLFKIKSILILLIFLCCLEANSNGQYPLNWGCRGSHLMGSLWARYKLVTLTI